MHTLPALSHHVGVRLAEVRFLLVLIAGVWLAASQLLARTGEDARCPSPAALTSRRSSIGT